MACPSARRRLSRLAPLALIAVVLSSGSAPAQPPRAERPTYTLGEKWIRSDGLFELIRVEKDGYVFSAKPKWEIHLTKDLGIVRIQRGDGVFQFTHPIELKWPLEGLAEKERIGVDGFTIGGRVTAGKGLATVVVTVNGADVATVDDRRAPKPEIALKVPVKLRDGKNVVIVTATDAEGTSRQE